MMAKGKGRQSFEVWIEAAELKLSLRIGVLHPSDVRTDVPGSFEYDEGWLRSKHRFMIDPRLELWSGEQHPPGKRPAFGVFMDSAPDRWGRVLMERGEAARARKEGMKVRGLQQTDFLLGVSDLTRVGALRFRASEGPFLDDSKDAAPPATSLRELAAISAHLEDPGVERLREYDKWLAVLLAPGTSLGGARPKANFTDVDDTLWIAKFPSREDRYDVGAWEFVTHRLAQRAGIAVPPSRIERLTRRYSTFCVKRFDRSEDSRRMFASAMTLLERQDGDEGVSYLDIAELISKSGATKLVDKDLEQLFHRVLFNVLVGNRDDHLRNHGFIRGQGGWQLSPAYDMNPNPHRFDHALTLDGATTEPDLNVVMETADLYRLKPSAAAKILKKIKRVVADWPNEASAIGLGRAEIERMRDVFNAAGDGCPGTGRLPGETAARGRFPHCEHFGGRPPARGNR